MAKLRPIPEDLPVIKRSTITHWVGIAFLNKHLGITPEIAKSRNVEFINVTRGKNYNLLSVIEKCPDIIHRRMGKVLDKLGKSSNAVTGEAALKKQKLKQEVRKLQLANDVEEGKLVDAEQVGVTYSRNMGVVCDLLDGIPSRVKMNVPDITPDALAAINEVLIEVRNSIAEKEFDEDPAYIASKL